MASTSSGLDKSIKIVKPESSKYCNRRSTTSKNNTKVKSYKEPNMNTNVRSNVIDLDTNFASSQGITTANHRNRHFKSNIDLDASGKLYLDNKENSLTKSNIMTNMSLISMLKIWFK